MNGKSASEKHTPSSFTLWPVITYMREKETAASQSGGHKSHSLKAANWEWDIWKNYEAYFLNYYHYITQFWQESRQ